MQVGRAAGLGDQIAVEADRALMLAETDRDFGGERAIVGIVGVDRQQPVDLGPGLGMSVPPCQALGIIMARGVVIGREAQDGLEQRLGIVEDLACDADPGEQTHRIGMIAVAQQIGADDLLGGHEIAVGEQ